MYGGSRDKWTKILANFQEIEAMDVQCNRQHEHAPWGFAFNEEGKQVWATSLESRYTRKMCVVLSSLMLQVASKHHLALSATDLCDVQSNPLQTALHSQLGAQKRPKPSNVPPLVPNFSSVATFLCEDTTKPQICSCAQRQVLQSPFPRTLDVLESLPTSLTETKGVQVGQASDRDDAGSPRRFKPDGDDAGSPKRFKRDDGSSKQMDDGKKFPFEVAFGFLWSWQDFVHRACSSVHPFLQDAGVPSELEEANEFHMNLNEQQLCKYRLDWC